MKKWPEAHFEYQEEPTTLVLSLYYISLLQNQFRHSIDSTREKRANNHLVTQRDTCQTEYFMFVSLFKLKYLQRYSVTISDNT